MIFDEIYSKIKQASRIAVFTHIRADGDCLGAGIAMYYVCKNLGKDVNVVNADYIHENFKFLTKDIVKEQLIGTYDLFISVDCSTTNMLGALSNEYIKHKNTINLDHHISNSEYAKLNYVDDKASSACEVLYDFFEYINVTIDKNIAEALLCGISTDTGCFMHPNTTSKTHLIASKLMQFDLNIDEMYFNLFKSKTATEISLTAKALEKIEFFHKGKLAITGLDNKEIKEAKATEDDIPKVVDVLGGIRGVQIAVTYRQDVDNGYKISFRSRGDIDVNLFAQIFGGGGHKNASGCKIYLPKNELIKLIEEKSRGFIKK